MKHTIRFIIVLFSLVVAGTTSVWGITENDIVINVLPNNSAGTVTVTNISGMTVTISATPATDYFIDRSHIIAEKMVDPLAAHHAPGIASKLDITDNGGNSFSFTIPTGYTGAYVTVNFYTKTEGFTQITSLSEITDMDGKYQLTADVSGISSSLGELTEFTGTLDGGLHKIIGSSAPLFASTDGAIIRNIIFEDVNISSGDNDGDAGAVTCKAKGATRIYNCGILPTSVERDNKGEITGFYGSSVGGTGNVGGLVGLLDGTSRVINCYSYANITGGNVVGGIVGNNNQTSSQTALNTIVVNCMFYGNITGGTSVYPVYGGKSINNDSNTGINPYCYFRKNATLTPTAYNRSWPAEEKNLTRFEYYRSVLNSNRKLCTWWVNGTSETAPTDEDVANVGIAKWVLDPSIAPYPILKKWGKYPSVINLDPDKVWDPRTEIKEGDAVTSVTPHWVQRSDAKEWEGKSYGTLAVTIKAGAHGSGSTSRNIPITDMDTLNCDYSYYKIQLPYYNEVFGNPNGATHAEKYGGNYTEYVVTGWEIEAAGSTTATDYNFADRNSITGRVFAQGGYYYVPKEVSSITITARWGKAFYLSNRGYSIDRVNVTNAGYKSDNAFAPAGTVSNTFQGQPVYDDLQNAIKALGTNTDSPTVYDQAIVLIGNHQVKNGNNGVGYSLDSKWHPFTIMSADFDFDNEPDYCLQFQFRDGTPRPGIQPVRFDFLPVVELGLALRHDNKAYAIGIFVPQGHFEVTETAFMRTTQFEYDGFNSYTDRRIEDKSPVIINGGEYEMFVVRYHDSNRTSYFLLGGNAWIHRFAPGAHPSNASPKIYLCPINVIGGQVKELYLTGLYRPELPAPTNQGAPRCYTDGGKFDIMAGAGYEKVEAGSNVTFKINHSKITEFYGGGINATNPISGNINVTIDNSYVDKYCGGPKVGDMTGKTVTTHATGTTFGVFYGGGNGGNSYYRHLQKDGDMNSDHIGIWTDNNYNWNGFKPLEVKDDGTDNKGYHAEYEFEVFNHSNGVTDQITQRGFIRWIQFGITKTGNVSSTLSDCKILGNFYGGGNLATVDGNVTSTLTNTQVDGSVFGAGYSAAIPTFQVHDKSTVSFPSITAGVITDGHIDYDSKVYEWTNEKLEGKDETYMKAHPTYEKDGKWYCYTWNSLDDLGAVTGTATLTIDGTTTVAHSVYGGGEESAVNGNTSVTVTGGTIGTANEGGAEYGNVYGGGKGKEKNVTAGLVKGNTTVSISGSPTIIHNVYGGGAYGSVGDFTYDASGMPTALATENTGNTSVTITGGTFGSDGKENGMVFGSSRGDVAVPEGTPAVDPNDRMAWVYSTHVTIGTSGSETGPTIKGSVYGSGENGHTFQNTQLDIHSGKIGITDTNVDGGAAYEYRGNVYGGGCGTDKYWIDANGNDVRDPGEEHYNAIAGIVRGNATVTIDGGHVVHNIYGAGAMGSVGNATDATSGKTTVTIKGKAQIGVEDISGNIYGAARGDQSVDEESFATVRTTQLEVSGNADIKGSVFGGGSLGLVKESTIIDVKGGSVHQSVYGGGSEANVKGNTTVTMTDGYIFNGIFGGGLSGSVGTFTRSTEASVVNIFGHTAHEGVCIGKPTACAENTGKCTIVVSGGQIGPIEVATWGMNRPDAQGGPVPEGWVWGGGRGLVESPSENPDVHFTAYVNETDVTIKDNAFILESIIGGGEFGRVLGNTNVKIEGGQIGVGLNQTEGDKPKRYTDEQFVNPSEITDENALVPCSHYPYGKTVGTTTVYETYDPYADAYKQAHGGSLPTGLEGGSTDNASDGKTWIGCVFGGGSGYFPYKATDTSGNITGYGWVESAGWVEGNANLTISGGHILSNVYGANEYTTVQGKSTVTMSGGTIGVPRTQAQIAADPKIGHLFGGGKGDPRPYFKNKTNAGSVEVAVSGGIIYGSVFGGGESGTVKGGVTVTMTGGTVLNDVYGGGALADTQTNNWDETKNSGAGDWAEGKTSASNTTLVRLTGGDILGEAYGGGLGETGKPAFVWGDVLLDLNGTTASGEEGAAIAVDKKGCTVNQVFGCNNAAGTPMGKVLVHVYATQNKGKANISTKLDDTYDVMAVYGGGNLAAYEPAGGKTTTNSTNVIIDGCGLTSIKQVYGGGNAASTPATKVTVNGTYEVEELFGGGNGKDDLPNGDPNPGANVGFYTYADDAGNAQTPADRAANYGYGSGQASLNVFGGTVHRVFGGSNTKGNVRQTAVTLLDENSGCPFCVDEAYGGGKSAPMDAEAKLLMACIPGLQAAYGGAEAAAIQGNVTLNITNGTFDRVFGGNNLSGTINGSITVNVEEVGCKPIKIGELYGGGNEAGYSVYGYDSDGKPVESGTTPLYDDPQVNVMSFTSIGNIYGGGYGEGATMVGNPTVNINEAYGRYYDNTSGNTSSVVDENAETPNHYPIPSHAAGKMGAINNVFGGGNAAKVIGNPTVNIGTLSEVYVVKEVTSGTALPTGCYTRNNDGTYSAATGIAQDGVTYYEKKDVLGADIRGNVYGGGNNAEVTGNTNVVIGKKNENQ